MNQLSDWQLALMALAPIGVILWAMAIVSVNSSDEEDAQRELEEQQRKLKGRRP